MLCGEREVGRRRRRGGETPRKRQEMKSKETEGTATKEETRRGGR